MSSQFNSDRVNVEWGLMYAALQQLFARAETAEASGATAVSAEMMIRSANNCKSDLIAAGIEFPAKPRE